MNQNLISYYNDRAKEYDKVYQIPEEQEDLLAATNLFQNIFSQKSVIEIACGTGYWTNQISKTATSIYATDINKAVIDIAKTRQVSNNVTFEVADMNDLAIEKKFEGLFGGFIWSHIPLEHLDKFLDRIKHLVIENGDIIFIDSNPVKGTIHDNKRITRTDQYGNTFQTRQLEDGTTHEVLKNFPANDFLVEKLSRIASDISLINLEHYWITSCKLKEAAINK